MKRMLPILTLAFLLVTTPASAVNGKGQEKVKDKKIQVTETCNPEDNWKNHGEYVSCVAKLKQGGQTTSEAAQSDVGKKNGDEDKSEGEAPSGSPTASPAAGIPDAVYLELKALTEVFKNILETLQKLYTN